MSLDAPANPAPRAASSREAELEAELRQARETILHLRDALIGAEAELGQVRGELAQALEEQVRYAQAAEHLQAVLRSRSWRISQAILAPLRAVRGPGA